MPRYLSIPVLLLAVIFTTPVFAADKSSGDNGVVHAGGLMCFSIRPPDTPTKPETKHSPPLYRSCDELCADKNAACTAAVSNFSPPQSCADEGYTPSVILCRCCAVVSH
jgi:hypothetical protein